MSLAERLRLRLRPLFGREQVTKELDREVQFHLEQQIAENIANGMSPSEAHYGALRSSGIPHP